MCFWFAQPAQVASVRKVESDASGVFSYASVASGEYGFRFYFTKECFFLQLYFIGVEIELKVLLTLASHVRKSKTMVRHFYNLHSKVFLKTYIYICQRMLLVYHLSLKIALNTSCKINVYTIQAILPLSSI